MSRRRQHVGRIEGARSGVSSGQPSVANGHKPDENQVSSTSGSRSQPSPAGALSATWTSSPRYQTGSWWPHQSLPRHAPRADARASSDVGPGRLRESALGPRAPPRWPARSACSCRRTTAARSAARCAARSGASGARRRYAGCPRRFPARAGRRPPPFVQPRSPCRESTPAPPRSYGPSSPITVISSSRRAADLEVALVVAGGHLERARAERWVDARPR